MGPSSTCFILRVHQFASVAQRLSNGFVNRRAAGSNPPTGSNKKYMNKDIKKETTILNFPKHLGIVLRKMCKMVGADPNKINFKKNNWYWDFSWTEQDEHDFINWLSEYLLDNADARSELMNNPIKNKKRTEALAREFVLNYGWKTK